jgi:hypothetical protein
VIEVGVPEPRERHGETDTPLWDKWRGMIGRCYTKSDGSYRYYGARGIEVCAAWRSSYVAFRDWAKANGYAEALELDRVSPFGSYEPANCRWVTHRVNVQNRRNTVWGTAYGETKCLRDWWRDPRCEVAYVTLAHRVAKGVPVEEAMRR